VRASASERCRSEPMVTRRAAARSLPSPSLSRVRAALEQAARFEFATLRMLSSTGAATVLDLAARAVTRPSADYEEFPQLAVLTTARDEPAAWLRAGQALQRVLLTAAARGLSASFLYQSIELRDMRGDSAPPWPWPENPQIVIRFGYGKEPPGTPRRPLDDVLTRAAAAQLR